MTNVNVSNELKDKIKLDQERFSVFISDRHRHPDTRQSSPEGLAAASESHSSGSEIFPSKHLPIAL